MAVGHCRRRGWRIVRRNWWFRAGEVDILADAGDSLVLVEVRGKVGDGFSPRHTLSPAKIRRLQRIASSLQRGAHKTVRIELVEIRARRPPGGWARRLGVLAAWRPGWFGLVVTDFAID